jgi:ketosteroid isomerase-like protein
MRSSDATIIELHEIWAQHEVDGDLDAWLDMVDDDVVLQPPGESQVTGKNAAAEFAKGFLSLPIAKMKVGESTVLLSEANDMALITGPIEFALDDPKQGYIEQTLKFMAVWIKVGNSWKVRSNSWSSDD